MKKRIICIALVLSALVGATLYAQPGDTNDPLVSKSYVDARVNDVLQLLGKGTTETPVMPQQTDVDEITKQVLAQLEYIINNDSATFTPVNVKKGQVLYGGEGCEVILRSGTCEVRISGDNGITNLTKGFDMLNGAKVEANNLLLIPRNDGRGFFVTSDEAWFLIKGEYIII